MACSLATNSPASNEASQESLFHTTTANMHPIRKKYRKMRIKFDEVMRESNNLVLANHLAEETTARLAVEIEYTPPSPWNNIKLISSPAVSWSSSSTSITLPKSPPTSALISMSQHLPSLQSHPSSPPKSFSEHQSSTHLKAKHSTMRSCRS